ncbi:MAG: hypothetical protein JXB23_08575, partial [Candidatus Aminicenantes bacterium]|nr:hypothetical protein [Candidatus Aminicenantes bacterium]
LEQIESLHLELQVVTTIFMIQRLHNAGLSLEEIAAQFQIPLEDAVNIIATKISDEDLSPDAKSSLEGEFFYRNTECDSQGFFILSVPRGKRVKLHLIRSGFHNLEKTLDLETGLSQNLGETTLFQQR